MNFGNSIILKNRLLKMLLNFLSQINLQVQYPDIIPEGTEMQKRIKRISRLEKIAWQIKYVKVFCLLCNKYYPSIIFENIYEKIKFYSAVYNIGFKSEKTLNQIRKIRIFPRFGKQKYSYEDVSLEFYIKTTQSNI